MHHRHRRFRTQALLLGIAGAVLAGGAMAAGDSRQAQYERDVAACRSGATGQNLEDCLREAGAVLTEARPNRHAASPEELQRNAQQRCAKLPPDQQQTCLETMTSPQTRTHGSVAGGGVLRERTITVPVDSTGMQPMPAPGTGSPAPQPMPGTSVPQPMPGTGTPQPMPGTSAPQPMPAPTPAPGTGTMAPQPLPAPGGPMGAPGPAGTNVR
ncbi:hypothetical protein V8Z80_00775 [Orrella sp. JC864]|uniref:hypothetical protein n=1 Tax=Orrella sp. JC864 TaxID=3120298 RepID=UPI00300B2897